MSIFSSHLRIGLLFILLMLCTLISVVVNAVYGIGTVYTHLFYVPIILTGVWYPRYTLLVALSLALLHITCAYVVFTRITVEPLLRSLIFLLVGWSIKSLIEQNRHLLTELEGSELKYRNYMEHAPDGLFVCDEAGRYLEVNSAAVVITGYSKQELLEMSIVDLLSPASVVIGKSHFAALKQEGAVSGDLQFCHKDTSERWWSVDGVKLSENRYMGFVKDITNRIQMDAKLKESEERYRVLVDQVLEGIALIEINTSKIIEINSRFTAILGYQLSEESTLHLDQIICMSKQETYQFINDAFNHQKKFLPVIHEYQHKNGRRIIVEHAASRVSIRGRDYLMMVLRDITEEHRRELALMRDIEFARRVQRELLTQPNDSLQITIRTLYYPQQLVSGDSYHLEWNQEMTVLRGFLVDVSGHGLATAIQTSSINVLLREASTINGSLQDQLQWINERALKYFFEGSYAAILGFEVDLVQRKLHYIGAGITRFFANGKKN